MNIQNYKIKDINISLDILIKNLKFDFNNDNLKIRYINSTLLLDLTLYRLFYAIRNIHKEVFNFDNFTLKLNAVGEWNYYVPLNFNTITLNSLDKQLTYLDTTQNYFLINDIKNTTESVTYENTILINLNDNFNFVDLGVNSNITFDELIDKKYNVIIDEENQQYNIYGLLEYNTTYGVITYGLTSHRNIKLTYKSKQYDKDNTIFQNSRYSKFINPNTDHSDFKVNNLNIYLKENKNTGGTSIPVATSLDVFNTFATVNNFNLANFYETSTEPTQLSLSNIFIDYGFTQFEGIALGTSSQIKSYGLTYITTKPSKLLSADTYDIDFQTEGTIIDRYIALCHTNTVYNMKQQKQLLILKISSPDISIDNLYKIELGVSPNLVVNNYLSNEARVLTKDECKIFSVWNSTYFGLSYDNTTDGINNYVGFIKADNTILTDEYRLNIMISEGFSIKPVTGLEGFSIYKNETVFTNYLSGTSTSETYYFKDDYYSNNSSVTNEKFVDFSTYVDQEENSLKTVKWGYVSNSQDSGVSYNFIYEGDNYEIKEVEDRKTVGEVDRVLDNQGNKIRIMQFKDQNNKVYIYDDTTQKLSDSTNTNYFYHDADIKLENNYTHGTESKYLIPDIKTDDEVFNYTKQKFSDGEYMHNFVMNKFRDTTKSNYFKDDGKLFTKGLELWTHRRLYI